ncbi:MAG: VWA domain-containing protein [bacterium]|nr:VWA domain-containing protein [bacterium]
MNKIQTNPSFFERFSRSTKGATVVIFAFMVVPIMALAGGVVDYGKALRVKSELVVALDAAVLAATQAYALDNSVDTEQIINDFITRNYSDSGKTLLSSYLVINTPKIDENEQLSVQLDVKVPTDFLKLVGFKEFDFSLNASAVIGGMELEIALVLDNTGSMSGSKIRTLRSAASDLVDKLIPDGGTDKVQIALVPFAEYVNIGTENRNEPGLEIPADYTHPVTGEDFKWLGCMGSRSGDLKIKDEDYATGVPGIMMTSGSSKNPYWKGRCPSQSIVRLTDDSSTIKTGIEGMDAQGWTYIPGGLAWGWRVLSNKAPFTQGVVDSEKNVQKSIILMTDGANTRAPQNWSNGATINHSGEVNGHSIHVDDGAAAIADPITAQLCENIKAEGIVVHTIAFEVPEGSPVEDLMRNCAGNGGQYYDADDAEGLANAFNQIALALLNLRLSK